MRHSGPRGVLEPSEDVSKYRIRSFSTTQKRSDSRTSLMAEIKALVDHRIHSVIHARNLDGVPSSEISSAVVGKLCIEIANNLDDVLESMADIVERRNLSATNLLLRPPLELAGRFVVCQQYSRNFSRSPW